MLNFLAAHGSSVSTVQLEALYRERPWLRSAIPHLREFWEQSKRLQYLPRSPETTAKIALTHTPSFTENALDSENDTEVYVSHFLSRNSLNAQVKRSMRPLPRGFKPRRRAHKCAQAAEYNMYCTSTTRYSDLSSGAFDQTASTNTQADACRLVNLLCECLLAFLLVCVLACLVRVTLSERAAL